MHANDYSVGRNKTQIDSCILAIAAHLSLPAARTDAIKAEEGGILTAQKFSLPAKALAHFKATKCHISRFMIFIRHIRNYTEYNQQ